MKDLYDNLIEAVELQGCAMIILRLIGMFLFLTIVAGALAYALLMWFTEPSLNGTY